MTSIYTRDLKHSIKNDLYNTPKSLIWVMGEMLKIEFSPTKIIFEPCSGENSIAEALNSLGYYSVITNDLYRSKASQHKDYLKDIFQQHDYVITNPPFSLWDAFVTKIKEETEKSLILGRLNYFATQSRFRKNLWKDLKAVYIFNRYVDYRTPYRDDGKFYVGGMASAWFLFEKNYTDSPTLHILDVSQFVLRGAYASK